MDLKALSFWAQALHNGSEGLGTAQLLPPYSLGVPRAFSAGGVGKAIGDRQGCSGLASIGKSIALAGRREKSSVCFLFVSLGRAAIPSPLLPLCLFHLLR